MLGILNFTALNFLFHKIKEREFQKKILSFFALFLYISCFIPNSENEEEKWKIAREIIVSFITELKPKVFYKTKIISSIKEHQKKEIELDISSALAILGSENTNEFKIQGDPLQMMVPFISIMRKILRTQNENSFWNHLEWPKNDAVCDYLFQC